MTALSLQAERLNNMPLPPDAARQSAVLQQSIRRNKHLLEQLLALARSQSDETPLTKTTFGLQSRFHQVLQELMPLALEKRQDIGVAVGGDVEVSADETEIYTLIKTFADNAVRYTPPEGRIDLGFTDERKYLAVWVEDNGNGIPESERARVLDPFYRILGTEQQGTGLGAVDCRHACQKIRRTFGIDRQPTFRTRSVDTGVVGQGNPEIDRCRLKASDGIFYISTISYCSCV
ncbi:HAMP domain-containing sensor histidine kinase [Neisseria meningitidis]|uniref:sensor histidine kinase n=1 Tax=Neisseria meningitidis TaxID=487 RepID=UPI00311CA800